MSRTETVSSQTPFSLAFKSQPAQYFSRKFSHILKKLLPWKEKEIWLVLLHYAFSSEQFSIESLLISLKNNMKHVSSFQ